MKELQLICGDSWCVISPSIENIFSTKAASKPKRSIKQPLNPDFEYDFPAMVFPTDFDPNTTPSVAAQSAAQVPVTKPPVTGAVAKKKSTKSAKIED